MYDFIEGSLEAIDKDTMTVEASGIGFRLLVGKSSSLRASLIKSRLRVWTEFVVREDRQELYGFATREERSLFCLLREVSGIGPKVALSICSASERKLLIQAIGQKNAEPLREIPGIGKKLAERIVVELHEKIAKVLPVDMEPGEDFSTNRDRVARAMVALRTLGFKEEEAKVRIKKASTQYPLIQTCEELIQRALQEE